MDTEKIAAKFVDAAIGTVADESQAQLAIRGIDKGMPRKVK
jgi:hypothetical protein